MRALAEARARCAADARDVVDACAEDARACAKTLGAIEEECEVRAREIAGTCESGGAWGHLRRRGTIQQMVPRVPFGPSGGYGVLLFTFLHSVHGVSQRGSVSVGSGVRGRLPLSCVVEPRTRPLPPASGGSCAASRALRRDRRCVLRARWRCPRRVRRLSSGIRYQRVETGCQPTVCRVTEDLVVGGLRSAQPLPGVDADCEQR